MEITWYTLKYDDDREDAWGGCMVEHFSKESTAIRRDNEVKQCSFYNSHGVTKHTVKNKRELIEWLNTFYDKDNG